MFVTSIILIHTHMRVHGDLKAEPHTHSMTLPGPWDKEGFYPSQTRSNRAVRAQTTACFLEPGMFWAEGGNQTHRQKRQPSPSRTSRRCTCSRAAQQTENGLLFLHIVIFSRCKPWNWNKSGYTAASLAHPERLIWVLIGTLLETCRW